MQTCKIIAFLLFTSICGTGLCQVKAPLTGSEQSDSSLFTKFLYYTKVKINNSPDSFAVGDSSTITIADGKNVDSLKRSKKLQDSSEITHVLDNYVLAIDVKGDLNTHDRYKKTYEEIHDLFDYLESNDLDALAIQPLRLTSNNLQKEV